MCPQGIPSKASMTVPIAPHRVAPGSGHAGFDHVSQLALLARGWFKGQGLPHTADAVIAMAALALKAERDARDADKRSAAPGVRRRQIEPKGEPNK